MIVAPNKAVKRSPAAHSDVQHSAPAPGMASPLPEQSPTLNAAYLTLCVKSIGGLNMEVLKSESWSS